MSTSLKLASTSRKILAILLIVVLFTPAISSYSQNTQADALASHWVQGWGYRDELNASDTDYQNFWTDNAGKILTMSAITGDTLDANHSLWFIQSHLEGGYLPETVVNSSLLDLNNMITNRIASLAANNGSDLQSLAVGNYYAGEQTLGYVGSDRILINGTIYRSSSSAVFQTATNQFVKRSLFSTPGGDFYVYVNATLLIGSPYVGLSIQAIPLNSTLSTSDLIYLQIFSQNVQFTNASLYDQNGNYVRPLVFDGGSQSIQNGTIIAYSGSSVFSQDSVALGFSNATSPVNDFELWSHDAAFDNYGWTGVAFNAPQDSKGSLSAPIFAKVYPIEHLDYRLVNDTAKYIAQNPNDTTVSPPVSFGFVAYGLALAAEKNASLDGQAKNYWNFYYSRYAASPDYQNAYARSINTFALAGFALYGCNSTVESFTRNFLGNTSGTSIEESGWAAAASYQLATCTGLASDHALYESFVNSFAVNEYNFVSSTRLNAPVPSYTFQFAEAASGLMLGGVPYNSPTVLALMSDVFQSNVSGTVLNQPYHGDLANTETLPAYMLATWLFQSGMRNETGGYVITGLVNVNLTSIDSANDTIVVGASGNNGIVFYSCPNGTSSQTKINGFTAMDLSPLAYSTVTTMLTEPTTTTAYQTITETQTSTSMQVTQTVSTVTVQSNPTVDILLIASIIFLAAGAFTFAALMRKRR